MSKNAEGWIRHNSKQQPVDDHVEVEIRTRGGDYEVCKASGFTWDATAENQIMAYRLHKPAEQVEACSKPELQINLPDGYGEIYNAQAVEHGPLQWRDRITTIDFDIHSLTTERAELVQKLASEGFALIERINELLTDAAQKHEDMSDWRNWKAGDLLEMVKAGEWEEMTNGKLYKFAVPENRDNFAVIDDDGELRSFNIGLNNNVSCDFKWHSRPSA